MKRVLVGMLASVLALGLMVSGAQAEKKGKKGGGKKAAAAAPNSAQIAESMGDLKWGMSKDELMAKFVDKVKEKYRPLVAKTKDAVKEDHLRQQAKQEMDAIRKGYVEFDGRSSGWNVSFLKGEFANGNDESMLVVRDANSQNFYFFAGGKLVKWFKAFDANVFPAGDFGAFAAGVERKFGKAKDQQGEIQRGQGARHWLEWQDKQTRLRAIDQTDFYGFYCLVFEEKASADQLAEAHAKAAEESGDKRHAMVESVTAERADNPDDSPDIADRISGKLRHTEQAPTPADDGDSEQASASSKSKGKSSKKPAQEESPVESSDDPISGLGL